MGSPKCSLLILVALLFFIDYGECACNSIPPANINPTWKSCEVQEGNTNATCLCPGCEEIQTNLVCNDSRWTHVTDKDKEQCLNCQQRKCWSGFQPWKVKCPKDTKNEEEPNGASKMCRCHKACDIIEIKCNERKWEYNNGKCNDTKIELPENLELEIKNEDFIFTCHSNYQLMGKNISKCENGSLKERPSCVPVSNANGMMDDYNNPPDDPDDSDTATLLPAGQPGVNNESKSSEMPAVMVTVQSSLEGVTEPEEPEGPPTQPENVTPVPEEPERPTIQTENISPKPEEPGEGEHTVGAGGDNKQPITTPENHPHTTSSTNTMEPSLVNTNAQNKSADTGNIWVVIFLAILLVIIVIIVVYMLLKQRKQQYDMEKCDVEMANRDSCVANEPEGGQITFDNDEYVEEDQNDVDPLIENETPEERKSIIGVLEINVPGESDELLKSILIPVNGPSPAMAVGKDDDMKVADNTTESGQVTKGEGTEENAPVQTVEKEQVKQSEQIKTHEEIEKVETPNQTDEQVQSTEEAEHIPPPENSEEEQYPSPMDSEIVQSTENSEEKHIPPPENSEEQYPPPMDSEKVQSTENSEQNQTAEDNQKPRLEPLNSVTSNELFAPNDVEQVTAKPVDEMPTFEEEKTENSTPEQRNSIAPDEVNDESAQIETTVD